MTQQIPYTRYTGYQPKRIAIFCDGTWQSIGGAARTNVALAAMGVERFAQDGRHQLTYYDDGVGALMTGWRRIVTGATGSGLDNRILSAYRFLTLNYEPGDEVYLFGFSRGAYTVRSLAGLIRTCGILRREYAHREGEAMALYRRRDGASPTLDSAEAVNFRLNFAREWVPPSTEALQGVGAARATFSLAYMGVWDTVGSLGIPGWVLANRKKYQFHDTSLGQWVRQARHAVAIDEKRNSFQPTLWSNLDHPEDAKRHPTAQQMWFPGDHGGVGGGFERAGLSNSALLWIIDGARSAGLAFKQSILDEYARDIEPINTPVRRFSLQAWLMSLTGSGWRSGLGHFEDVHESARRRYVENKSYRPRPLKPFKDKIKNWNQFGDVAG
jgi:uncharacterized protein (DUF2235 family)